ncbi:MAG: transketolase [Acidimicrobiaceae bacterium]|nr:MAG: transketolase [marine actinobacterium MedAcidi-G2A]MBA4809721.1 transketolase [Acidimicrobiales bacterium]MBC84359.1 transketolase [Acidimicrobiaceae bacterium]OUV00531.1 MAG: transketolase [Acidimicrobiaceae bacterium TMED77]|tara:strand:- start:3240 stop:5132 length:1893 start_codon:yes stop_codon:yes gene_type:complete
MKNNDINPELEELAINTIRGLAMDAPHKARSGHQGTAMALAPLAHVLYTRIMRYSANYPNWANRDRFILSAGHASILQYSMLYLTGYGLSLNDIKDFRQWGSQTPGHPEVGHTAGVEVTTGPLGQGFANAVGMAISERWMRHNYGESKINHRIFTICGDGDLSEGISHEAASLAAQQKLGRLICIYDDNHVTIDGPTELSLQDDAAKRFEAYGWNVIDIGESGEDLDSIESAFRQAIDNESQPSLIIIRSHIGYPSPSLTDSPSAHGYAFKDEEIAETKRLMGLPTDSSFYVPDDVLNLYRRVGSQHDDEISKNNWSPESELGTWDLSEIQSEFESKVGESVATRVASGECLNSVSSNLAIIAGGADLTGNTGTALTNQTALSSENPSGKQLYFGVREHAMGAIMNGIALHGGIIPVGGTFLVFSDYMRPAIRLAALTQAKVIYSFTHDSVGVGEDGPTHQPVEQIMSLRAIPGLNVIRPADAKETVAAWISALNHDGPTALILSRQNLPILEETNVDKAQEGSYVLIDTEDPEATLVATGSEVSLCIEYAEKNSVRVISMPSWELTNSDSLNIDTSIPSLSLEAGITLGWSRFADINIGIDRFGSSAPGNVVMNELGINIESIQNALNQ